MERAARTRTREVGIRAALLLGAWWIVSEGQAAALIVGLPLVAITALASLWLAPAPLPRLRPLALSRFLRMFLAQSALGGIDVARRAYHPALPLKPAMRAYDVAAMGAAERVAFAVTVSLLPGTLSARLDGDVLRLHVLDAEMAVAEKLGDLERHLAPVFGRASDGGARQP